MKKIYSGIFIVFLMVQCSLAQVAVTNPTNTTPNLAATYTSLANAITALSGITSISGPVTLTLNAGNPQTAPAGGYVIQFAAATSASNTITFDGSNNIITAYTPQVAGQLYDGIFKLVGADHITLKNFTMRENPANTLTTAGTNNMTEWGVAMLKATSTNGCQNNTIQNNTISLDRNYRNTFGIYGNIRHTTTSITAITDISNVTGANTGNRIYSNNISNVDFGVVFVGSSTSTYMDNGNDIGGSSAATGNTISNWGGNSTALSGYSNVTSTSYCIYMNQQINENVSYNTITSANVSGATFTFGGILKDYTIGTPAGTISSTITYNTITLTSSNISGAMTVIQTSGGVALSTYTIHISNNTLLNCSLMGSSAFSGISNTSAPGVLNMNNNIIRGTASAATGLFQGMVNTGAVVTTLNMNNNQLGVTGSGVLTCSVASTQTYLFIYNTSVSSTAVVNINNNSIDGISVVTTGVFYGIFNHAANAPVSNINNNQLGSVTGTFVSFSGAQTSSLSAITSGGGAVTVSSVQNNDVRGIVHAVTASGYQHYIYISAANLTTTVSGNTFTNMNVNTTGRIYLIYDAAPRIAGQVASFDNNRVVTGFSNSSVGGFFYGFYSAGGSVNGAVTSITNNNFSNITVTGATFFYGIAAFDGQSASSGPTEVITGNTISNITGGTLTVFGIEVSNSAGVTCSMNTISAVTCAGSIIAIHFGNVNGQGTFTASLNTISSLASSAGFARGFSIIGSSVPTVNVHNNTITGLSSAGAGITSEGILLFGGVTLNVYDNIINNITGSGTTSPSTSGIRVVNGTTLNIYRNKIYDIRETGTVSTASGAVNGIYLQNIAAGTVNAYNNFISDLKAPNASLADAIRGISMTSTTPATTFNLYHNSIYINASSAGTNFGTTGIYHTSNFTATTGALTMIGNIIVNTSTPQGTGSTVAFRRTAPTFTNYATGSDHNLFYAGTPSASRLIFTDGPNLDQTIAAYRARVSPRDANSITAMPNFVSATDLHLTGNNCNIDGRGTPVGIVTDDIDLEARHVTNPDIGADEFTATTSTTLAGVTGAAVCEERSVYVTGTLYTSNTCDLIARLLPSGADPVAGMVKVCVTLDATQQYFNGEPYVQRHFDLEPTSGNQSTTSATIFLYFTNAEFVQYNSNNPVWPPLPTVGGGGNADPNRANVKVTQFHGAAQTSPSSPGNYPGSKVLITPSLANITWNGLYWIISVDVSGFSGFYVHTNNFNGPLPVSVNYFNGTKQGGDHLLNWKVTCNSTPRVTMELQRGADSRNFSSLNNITADAVRCAQPFSYTDADPLSAMNYYRLKMTDADGKISFSSVVALLNAVKGFDIISIAPNPVVGGNFILNVTSASVSNMELVILDLQGRLMSSHSVELTAAFSNIPVNVSRLSPGTYTIYGKVGNDRSGIIRFVKQ